MAGSLLAKLLAAVVDVSNGEILGTAKKKTNPDDDAKALMERIYDGIDEAMDMVFGEDGTDGNGGTDLATVEVTVTGANDDPVAPLAIRIALGGTREI